MQSSHVAATACRAAAALAAMIARGLRGALIRGKLIQPSGLKHGWWRIMAGAVRTVLIAESSLIRLCKVSCKVQNVAGKIS